VRAKALREGACDVAQARPVGLDDAQEEPRHRVDVPAALLVALVDGDGAAHLIAVGRVRLACGRETPLRGEAGLEVAGLDQRDADSERAHLHAQRLAVALDRKLLADRRPGRAADQPSELVLTW
jgi:hypothetical protein